MQSTHSSITIFHNPACGTSRNTLALIRNSGEEPRVVEYLKTPPSKETLARTARRHEDAASRAAAQKGHAL
jgi:arsenate reductase-like glutaredoxin family protein